MKDKALCYIGTLIVITYIAYLALFPEPADGVMFSGVIGALGLLAGVKLTSKGP